MSTPQLKDTDRVFYHLSHTDLDGYGAQYMLRAAGIRARYYNADYRDIPAALDEILASIRADRQPATLLITDLNLSVDQARELAKRVEGLNGLVSLQLLDHHATGAEAAAAHDWYYLDTDKCAALLTYEACAHLMGESERERMQARARLIDVGDRWLKWETDFTRAIYLIGLVMEDDHLAPPLVELKRAYRFHLMDECFKHLEKGESLEHLERSLYDIRKAFLKGRIEKAVFADAERPLKDKYHYLSAQLLNLDDVPMIEIDGAKAGVFFNWPHDVYRGVIMELMENRRLMDMAISVRGNGRLSLRSNEGVNVGEISSKYFGGGGHPGAAGGALKETRLRDARHAVKAILNTVQEGEKR